jgi:D-sedoheptulose 7-phosphate isomerase
LNRNMSLSDRATEFINVLNGCEVTTKDGATLTLEEGGTELCEHLNRLRQRGNSLFLVGNGGSAGVASHAATDFFNVARLRAMTLHESSLITCIANDFGYEHVFSRIVNQLVKPRDILIAISSSGNSFNIRNAAEEAANLGAIVITLTGFACDNPLRAVGDLNIWLDSTDYGFVEIGHQFILHNISDRFGAGLMSESVQAS